MNRFTFHGVNHERDLLYNYARIRDKALTALGPSIFDNEFRVLVEVYQLQVQMQVLCPTNIFWLQVTKQPPVVLTPSCPERKK